MKQVTVNFTYSRDYSQVVKDVQDHLYKEFKGITFINMPTKVIPGCHKPYSISVNDITVHDVQKPLNNERKPLLVKNYDDFGEPEPGALERLKEHITRVSLGEDIEEKTA